ncbi:hypothetical protein BASA50_000907 [Batrachochytrium salamandrivorans]|uniref:SCP domain-containing protein n=1 Tax=Batrachochytrium salamandrivorans TaxID=1357716 RepID=A0ABQ8ESN9_9FUNG|nr:hypothetical protein BASA60_002058 [Batrachochytrium salamandrivorans]KAH6585964.1 hypothetical protein BASA50_000907 [Batrachochytrium salamandrivorans]KAH9275750.1 hypothetical protein BASA83_001551 [Batrachochytrium salamandrivorans]
MLLSISLISIAMFNAMVNAQYDDYNSGFQQSLQYNRPGYQRQPSYTPNTDASDECESMKTSWGQKGCDQQMCQYWAKKYNIKPLENGGSIPSNILSAWDHEQMQCNLRVGPYSTAQCKAAAIKFRTYPIGI